MNWLRRPWIWLVALCAAAYATSLPNSFQLDDWYRISGNPGVERFWPPWRHFTDAHTMSALDRIVAYRPLLPLSFSLQHLIAGHSLWFYRFGNLALAALSGVLFARVLVKLGLREECAWGAAALWTLHPVTGVLVNYLCSRDTLGMQVFFLLAFSLHLQGSRWAWLNMELGLLCKANAALMPAFVFAHEWTRGTWKRALAKSLPYAGVLAAHTLFVRYVLHISELDVYRGPLSSLAYAKTQAHLLVAYYLPNLFWPWGMRPMPDVAAVTGPLTAPGLATVLLLAASVWLYFKVRAQRPLLALSAAAFWLFLLPESSFVSLHQLATDYRIYPSLAWLLAAGAEALQARPRVALAAACACALWFIGFDLAQNRVWRTGVSLWTHAAEQGTTSMGHMNLAMDIDDRRDPRVRRELEIAANTDPDNVLAHINLGLWWMDAGRDPQRGLAMIEKATRGAPRWAQAHYWLARAYERVKRYREGADEYVRAGELDPGNVEYVYQAALAMQGMSRFGESLPWLDATDRLDPDYKDARWARGFALQKLGRLEDALRVYDALLKAHPDHAVARSNEVWALVALGRCNEAQSVSAQLDKARQKPLEPVLRTCTSH